MQDCLLRSELAPRAVGIPYSTYLFRNQQVYHHVLPFDSGSAFPLTSNLAKKDTARGRIGGGGHLAYLRPQFPVPADLVQSYLYVIQRLSTGPQTCRPSTQW